MGNQPAGPLGTIARGIGGKFTLRENAYEVRLNASVFDLTGRSVQTLDKDAFRVYEDGVPQTIASFRHEDLPVSLGILIDSSGSMYDKRAAVDQASLDLVKLSNPEDEAFLVDFSWEAFIDRTLPAILRSCNRGCRLSSHRAGRRFMTRWWLRRIICRRTRSIRSRCCW
jgi:hypothetical protein